MQGVGDCISSLHVNGSFSYGRVLSKQYLKPCHSVPCQYEVVLHGQLVSSLSFNVHLLNYAPISLVILPQLRTLRFLISHYLWIINFVDCYPSPPPPTSLAPLIHPLSDSYLHVPTCVPGLVQGCSNRSLWTVDFDTLDQYINSFPLCAHHNPPLSFHLTSSGYAKILVIGGWLAIGWAQSAIVMVYNNISYTQGCV